MNKYTALILNQNKRIEKKQCKSIKEARDYCYHLGDKASACRIYKNRQLFGILYRVIFSSKWTYKKPEANESLETIYN